MTPAHRPGGPIVFDQAAGYYDATRGIPEEASERVADLMEAAAGPDARFLELGVGTGRIALPLHRRGRTVVGVDLSVPMLERYRAKAAAAHLPPPPLLRGDVTRLPLRDACVDAVIEVHVLHLIPAWREAVAEARRVLAPGGTMLLAGRDCEYRSDGPWRRTRERWRAVMGGLGGLPERVGARDDREVRVAFAALGGRIEEQPPVTWQATETWGASLRIMERRRWSLTWLVPDDLWERSLPLLRAEIAAEAAAGGVGLDTPIPVTLSIELAAIRF